MDSVDQIEALARRLFDAIERGSIDEVLEIYAPDAVIWHNTDGLETGPADNVAVLTAFVGRISERRYRDRRLKAFPGGFVQQHVLTGVRRDGPLGKPEVASVPPLTADVVPEPDNCSEVN